MTRRLASAGAEIAIANGTQSAYATARRSALMSGGRNKRSASSGCARNRKSGASAPARKKRSSASGATRIAKNAATGRTKRRRTATDDRAFDNAQRCDARMMPSEQGGSAMTVDRLVVRLSAILIAFLVVLPLAAQNLEIHVINVGWGQASFIKGPGPTGKTVLLEAGNTGKGTAEVVPYLQSIGHLPAAGFDYSIVGHQHCDHAGGMDEVISAGYDVRIRNYDNGSSYTSSCITGWDSAAGGTTAGTPVAMTRGEVIDLGGGATLTCIVVRGQVIGGGNVAVSNENDLSIGLLLKYGGFDYFWASDLGGGADDNACTGRNTSQLNVETTVINAISPGGASPLISAGGIDVLHVSHHGSESSTNNDLFDGAEPAVAVISTGAGQDSSWNLPRTDVVDSVLLANASSCVTAPPTFVLQSEEGSPTGSLTSFSGYCVGDILITTDGLTTFTVDGNGSVTQGPNERVAAGLPRSFTLDDSGGGGGGDTQPPTTSMTAPVNGATVSGATSVTASASDNVGVTRVEFWLDGAVASTDTTAPYEWS